MLSRLGVRGRLLLAFAGICALAAIGAAAATYPFFELVKVVDLLTQRRVPSALASQELSRQSERIVAAAPALLTVTATAEHQKLSNRINAEVKQLGRLVAALETTDVEAQSLAPIESTVEGFRINLTALDELVASRLVVAKSRQQHLEKVTFTHTAILELLNPWELTIQSAINQSRQHINDLERTPQARIAAVEGFDTSNSSLRVVEAIRLETGNVINLLRRLSLAQDTKRIKVATFRVKKSLKELGSLTDKLAEKLRPRVAANLAGLSQMIAGTDSLPMMREQEIGLTNEAQRLLEENGILQVKLTAEVDSLLSQVKREISKANLESHEVQRLSMRILLGAIAFTLVSSILIVWLYVGRNLIARLTGLSDSMLAIAGGNLHAPLPPRTGTDEIAGMAQALAGFRDTAVEVQENNLRDIAQARQRLIDALESTSEGFAFYDADDRLELSNTQYRKLMFDSGDGGNEDVVIEPGMQFESLVRQAAAHGSLHNDDGSEGDIEALVQERLQHHRNPQEALLQRRGNGRWVQISERKTEGGGTVAVYSDLTELKESEQRAAHANRQILESLHYAGRIQAAMMPSRDAFTSATRDHFLIWEPRDIVGGDFFWFHRMPSGYAIVVGDCTGHGVPGAFMTLISCGLLDRAFNAGADRPSQILGDLHRELQTLLAQDQDHGDTDDGVEVGMCFVSEAERKLVFGGARFSLWQAGNGTIEEIKGDKAGIGYRRLSRDTSFSDVEVDLNQGNTFYMTTDGLIDQIGGARGRSFGKKRFSNLIAEQQLQPMAEQADALLHALGTYQGDQVRRDDLTVMGFQPFAT